MEEPNQNLEELLAQEAEKAKRKIRKLSKTVRRGMFGGGKDKEFEELRLEAHMPRELS